MISVLIASGIAAALGCTLNEGGANPCPFMGVDLGDMLVTLFVLGWLGLLTLPIGAMALAAWLVALVITLLLRRRRRRVT